MTIGKLPLPRNHDVFGDVRWTQLVAHVVVGEPRQCRQGDFTEPIVREKRIPQKLIETILVQIAAQIRIPPASEHQPPEKVSFSNQINGNSNLNRRSLAIQFLLLQRILFFALSLSIYYV